MTTRDTDGQSTDHLTSTKAMAMAPTNHHTTTSHTMEATDQVTTMEDTDMIVVTKLTTKRRRSAMTATDQLTSSQSSHAISQKVTTITSLIWDSIEILNEGFKINEA